MERSKGATTKRLIRNTSQPLPKNVTCKSHRKEPPISSSKPAHEKPTIPEQAMAKLSLDVPKPNASLKIAREINCIGRNKNIKAVAVIDDSAAHVLQDKITKLVNFPFDKAIYKDLIPLTVTPTTEAVITPRVPLKLKDKEPVLSDFVKLKAPVEYRYDVKTPITLPKTDMKFDPLKIDKMINRW